MEASPDLEEDVYSHQDGPDGVVHVPIGGPAQQLSEAGLRQRGWVVLAVLTGHRWRAWMSRPARETEMSPDWFMYGTC